MKKALKKTIILLLAIFSFTNLNAQTPCDNCNSILIDQSQVLIENYRYNIVMITPLVGQNSESYAGGSFDNDISRTINIIGAIMGVWDSLKAVTFGTVVTVNQLLNATGQYWEQISQLRIQFQYDSAVIDRDYCNCLQTRGCANGCYW